MRRDQAPLPVLAISNPNKAWVSAEIDRLLDEWEEWFEYCLALSKAHDSLDYDPKTCSDAVKDGFANIKQHELLREKTLVFLRNHFSGAEFIYKSWPRHPHEDVTGRLAQRVPVWIHRIEILKASMDYVLVPEGFWQEQSKKFLETLSRSTADGAIDVAKSYLKNPLGS